jgi:proline dehydrogenase
VNTALRRVFLALSRNGFLRRRLPRLPFMRRAVGRFMPGETADAALAAAATLVHEDIASEYTRLGENVTTMAEADAVAEHYLDLYERIRAEGLDGEISVKLTQLGLDIDAEATYAHCERLAAKAEQTGSFLWIDMEDSSYVERTLALYERLRKEHPRTGV